MTTKKSMHMNHKNKYFYQLKKLEVKQAQYEVLAEEHEIFKNLLEEIKIRINCLHQILF